MPSARAFQSFSWINYQKIFNADLIGVAVRNTLVMTAAAAGLTLWAVRRLTAPVRTLAKAADALGRDVNAPPLP